MAGKWRETTLDQLGHIVTGKTPPSSRPECFSGDIPFVTPTDFDGRRVIEVTGRYLSEQGADIVRGSRIPARAVMVSCIGSDMGKAAVAGRDCVTNQQINSIVVDSGNDPLFVYYNLSARKTAIRAAATGSAQPILNKTAFGRLDILLPPPNEQRAIGHILGALDDKIELHRRINETLEAMARARFKSWFVDFDPVRDKAEGRDPGLPKPVADVFPGSFEDSELGEIPAGWRLGRLDEVLAELVSGARPKGGAVEKGVPSIGAENVIGLGRYDFSKEKFVPREFFEQLMRKGAAVRPADVLLYKDGAQIGRKTYFDFDFPHSECAINEHVFVLRAKRPEEQRFLFLWLDQAWMTQKIISLNSNSAQPGINQPGVRGLPVLIPPDRVINAFGRLAAPLFGRLFAACNESRALATLREVLLPKLISGAIRIADLHEMPRRDR